jgi:Glycosyltransferases, probably involved in cell wall biogenesis
VPEVSSLHAIELIVTLYLGLTAVLGTTVIAVTATKMRRVWVGSARTVKYRDVIRRDPLAVSLIVPVYNEPDEAIGRADRLAGLAHPRLEVILVNDGSTDQTMRRLRQSLHLREALPSPSGSLPTREVLGVYRSQLCRA